MKSYLENIWWRIVNSNFHLQALVDTAKLETDADDVGLRDGNA